MESSANIWKTAWRLLRNLKIDLSPDPVKPFLGICPNKVKTAYERVICVPMLIVAQVIIAKIWNQPRCPSMNDCTKKMLYTYPKEYYLAIKKNKILPFAKKKKLIQLEPI